MNNIVSRMLLLFALCTISSITMHAQTTEFLSSNHSMVHIEASAKYILLPIEERSEISQVRLISGGNELQNLNVRLAVDNIDYYVPLDVSEMKGQPLLLDVITSGDKRNEGDIKGFVCWKNIQMTDSFDTTNREQHRPLYHHTPLWGWMNDPNGLFYKDGVWHLYYQHNPYGSQWENMTWGHSTSNDLVHWQNHGDAVFPDALGTVFSGCCVVDKNNTAGFGAGAIVGLYTSAKDSQTQSLIYSTDDGMTFTKYAGNPIITADVPDFRDPHVFWNDEIGRWNLILAAGQEMRIYTSANLKDWTYESSFGHGYGNHDGVWECPDLIKLTVEGTGESKWLLLCNINPGGPFGGSATQYFVGDFDGSKFMCDTKPAATKWLDYGKDHYAAVTFDNAPDGRHVLIGWMSNWQYANQVPTKQYRSANTIARDLFLFKHGDEVYAGAKPSPENLSLRGKAAISTSFSGKTKHIKQMFANPTGAYEIVMKFAPADGSMLKLTLSNSKGEKLTLCYNAATETLSMDRRESGQKDFSDFFNTVTSAKLIGGDMKELRLFVDKSSIEAFANDGKLTMTNIIFPSEPYNSLTISSDKRVKVSSLKVFSLCETK